MTDSIDLTSVAAIERGIGKSSFFGVDFLAKAMRIVTGAGTPSGTSTVPEFIGQTYHDTTNGTFYMAKGTSAASDFVQIG